MLIGILVAVIVGGLGVLAFLLLSGDDDDDTASDTTVASTEAPDTEPPDTDAPDTEPPDTEPPDTEPPDTEPPDTEPDIDTEGEMVSVFDLSTGDCWDDPDEESATVGEVEVVDCDDPHDNEVYVVFDLPDGDYDQTAVQEAADAGCLEEFEPFVGIPWEDSSLDYFNLTPTEASWAEGDREVICSVYDLELRKLVGSMEGSGV